MHEVRVVDIYIIQIEDLWNLIKDKFRFTLLYALRITV